MNKLFLAFFLTLTAFFSNLFAQTQRHYISATIDSIDAETKKVELIDIHSEEAFEHANPLLATAGVGDIEIGYEGQRVNARVYESNGNWRVDKIWPIYEVEGNQMIAANRLLRQDTATRKNRQFRKEGDYMINFALFNDHGKVVQSRTYQGEWLILNFIFTRCRVPEMCPAQTKKMKEMQQTLAEKGVDNIHFASITFDPNYDTPGILRQYANAYEIDPENFDYLTGPKDVIIDVLKQFGVIAYESENIVDHTVTTLLFDKTGKIVMRKDGTRWSAKDFVNRVLRSQS